MKNPLYFSLLFISVFLVLQESHGVPTDTENRNYVKSLASHGIEVFGPAGNLAAGVNIHFTSGHRKDLDMIAAAGLKYIRTDFIWQDIEYANGKYNWDAYDELVDNLSKRHLRAIFILDYSNSLYEDPVDSKNPVTGQSIRDIAAPTNDKSVAAFSLWAAKAAARYSGRKIVWEIWNEPNISFWKPAADVKNYARLALSVCKALRAAEPETVIIGPATSQIPFYFIESFMKSGVLDYLDGISVHPYRDYSLPPESAAQEYNKLKDLIKLYAPVGRKDIPVISSEWGYSSCTKGVTPEIQAEWAVRMQLSNLMNGIPVSIWYDWKNDGNDPADFEHNCGTVTPDLNPKPSYNALRILSAQLGNLHFTHRIDTGNENDYLLLFSGAKGIFRLCAWTTDSAHSVRLDAIIPHTEGIIATDGYGNPAELKTEGDGLTLNLAGMPQYISLPCGIRLN